jgi:hypothetical protein
MIDIQIDGVQQLDMNSADQPRPGRRRRVVPTPDDPAFLVTLPILCAKLKLPLKWARREASEGRLPCLRVGHRLLFHVQAVSDFLRLRAARKNQDGQYVN